MEKLSRYPSFQKKLQKTQIKYSTFERKLLAIYMAIKYFRHQLEGRQFVIFTDHKPLLSIFTTQTERSPRQSNHIDFCSQFLTDICYVEGRADVVADSLSRNGCDVVEDDC